MEKARFARELGPKIEREHEKYESHRKVHFSPGCESIGIFGQLKFEDFYDYRFPMDTRILPEGDRSVDFYTPAGTVDIKTARIPKFLPVEESKMKKGKTSDFFVLCHFLGWDMEPKLVGCATREEMRVCDTFPLKEGAWPSHNKLSKLLHSMAWLTQLINEAAQPTLLLNQGTLLDPRGVVAVPKLIVAPRPVQVPAWRSVPPMPEITLPRCARCGSYYVDRDGNCVSCEERDS